LELSGNKGDDSDAGSFSDDNSDDSDAGFFFDAGVSLMSTLMMTSYIPFE